jgi:thioredoxin 1
MNITKDNFNDLLEKSTEMPVLIDFWASWCGPCRMLAPVIEELAKDTEGKAVIGKVNVDEETELSEKFNVFSIPTIVVLKDKKIVAKSVGYKTLGQLKTLLGV